MVDSGKSPVQRTVLKQALSPLDGEKLTEPTAAWCVGNRNIRTFMLTDLRV
jgi:hypothetical protein